MEIGSPVIRVRDIEKVSAFYERVGLQSNKKYQDDDDKSIYEFSTADKLSTSDKHSLVVLKHDPEAKNASPNSAGLFHFAILVPDRKSLALTYLALRDSGVRYDGFGDHLVSESLYLRDPENNGIEIYRDRPSTEWIRDSRGQIRMDTLPLDLNSMISEELNNEERKSAKAFPSGARIGHIHLKVTNLERSIKFYHGELGLDITLNYSSMGAAFLSGGGYHHQIGINVWYSLNGKPRTRGENGLEYFVINIPRTSSSINTIRSFMHDHATKQHKRELDEEQILASDPDGIQFFIKSS
jgi:catechol 2,3-dioxygenase